MTLHQWNEISTKNGFQEDEAVSAIFSLEESRSYYLVSVDLPSIPAENTEVISQRNELLITGVHSSENEIMKQTFFRCRSDGSKIKAAYQGGVLWLLLPKSNLQKSFESISNIERPVGVL